MDSRLICWLAAARDFFGWHGWHALSPRRASSSAVRHTLRKASEQATPKTTLCRAVAFLTSIVCLANMGCAVRKDAVRKDHLQRTLDRSAAKLSFISWNLRAKVVEPRESAQSRAFRIAALSNRELYRLMETRPAPDLATISGKWNGINKGVGSAMFGLMQDVKVLEGEGCVTGYNILVKQVSIKALPCRGWQPERDPKTCKPKTMGNFVAVAPTCCGELGHTVKLDYTIAENPWYDPSRFLIDQLVAIDHDLLLGRATAKIGSMQIPVAYFVLSRAPECDCSSESSSVAQTPIASVSETPEYSLITPTPSREIVDREIIAEPAQSQAETTVPDAPTPQQQQSQPDADRSASDKPIVHEVPESLLID